MNSLISQAFSSSNSGSARSNATKKPEREDRFILEHSTDERGRVHKYLRSDIVVDGLVYDKDRTSFTRSCSNVVSKSQFMLQTLENLGAITVSVRFMLMLGGVTMRDGGYIYDRTFPVPLRNWIEANATREELNATGYEDIDADILKSLISQLIMLYSIRSDLK